MTTLFPGQVTAFQVGSYFVGQYYQTLQQMPSLVHQFYNDVSTMVRFDGAITESASGMRQINSLIMGLNVTGIEIKTANSLASWNGGVLIMVSGIVQTKLYISRRKFVQTFFLAPQENGYFVLNDMFQFLEEEPMYQHPQAILAHTMYNKIASNPLPEPISDYILREEVQTRDFTAPAPAPVEENVTVDKYSIAEPLQQQVPQSYENIHETPAKDVTHSFTNVLNVVRDPPPAPVEEPVGEPPKHTYASILRIAKVQHGQSAPHSAPSNNTASVVSEWQYATQTSPQQSHPTSSCGPEQYNSEAVEETAPVEDEGESKSVYVGNIPSSTSVSQIEQEFKNFGRIIPDGVTIRSRKETGVYYAFVEFEDAIGVHNAIQASPVQINGRQVHVEGRRPNSGASRGRRGRGRGGYYSEAPRGRYGGRAFGRGQNGQDYGERDYSSRPRGNGYIHRPRQERGILGSHQHQRNGQFPTET